MDPFSELRTLIAPVLPRLGKTEADKIEKLVRRLEKNAAMQEKKLERAIQDRQAVHSLMKKTSDDLFRRYQTIFEHAGNAKVVIDESGTILLANTLFCRIIGEEPAHVENRRNIFDYLCSNTGDPMAAAIGTGDEEPGDPTRTSTGQLCVPGGTIDVLISIGSFPGSTQRIISFIDISERLRLEQQFVETSNFLSGILKASPVGFHMTDSEGKLLYINDTWTAITGYPPSAVLGRYYASIIHPEDMDRVVSSVRDSAHRQEAMAVEARIVRPDGSIRWVYGQAVPVNDPDGRQTGWVGAISDITDARAIREELRKSEIRFREMANLLPLVIFEIDQRGDLTYINQFGLNVFGITEDKLEKGIDAFSLLLPADRERARARLMQTVAGNTDTRDIYALKRSDGSNMLALIHVASIKRDGVLLGFRGSVIDVTELKRVEADLRQRKETFEALTENTPDLIFSASTEGLITYISPQVRQLGFSPEEVVGNEIFRYVFPADRERVKKQFYDDLRTSSRSTSVYRAEDRDGGVHWVEQKVSLIRSEAGQPLTIFGILHDITERKNAEAAIELANRKLNLMNNITRHDILNTLTGIFGLIDMIRAGGRMEEDDQLLAEIREQAKVIQWQIAFTKQYQEVGIRMPQWQNVRATIEKVIPNFEKPPFVISAQIGDIEVYADPLFEKVIYNLIDNAIRYAETANSLQFSARKSDRMLILVCEDNGTGVPADQKERIFERGIGRNTGMGLFLTREILEITGISISENGIPGKGARFEIRVPLGSFREPVKVS